MSRSTRPDDAITIPVAPLRRLLIIVIASVALLVIAVLARENLRSFFNAGEAAYVDATTYQSVVLVTNQAYFGKLRIDGDVYTLTEVYSFSSNVDPASGVVQLVKRGNELHGPEEPLVLPARSVLFFENMRPDSQVMQAIAKIRSGQTSTPPPAAPTRTATPSPTR